jgi:hypothetical protein
MLRAVVSGNRVERVTGLVNDPTHSIWKSWEKNDAAENPLGEAHDVHTQPRNCSADSTYEEQLQNQNRKNLAGSRRFYTN